MASIQLNVSFSHQLPGCAKPGSLDPDAIWNASLPAQDSNVAIRNGLGFRLTPISNNALWKRLVGLRGLQLAEQREFISPFNWDWNTGFK